MSMTNEERQTLVRREIDGISIAADFIKAIEQLISEKKI